MVALFRQGLISGSRENRRKQLIKRGTKSGRNTDLIIQFLFLEAGVGFMGLNKPNLVEHF